MRKYNKRKYICQYNLFVNSVLDFLYFIVYNGMNYRYISFNASGRYIMKKRIIALIMTLILILLTFSGCSSSQKPALNISKAEVTPGVYTYFYDYVYSNRKSFKIKGDDIEKEVHEKAVELIKEYIAVNTMAEKLGVSLSYTLRAQTASKTDSRWDLFGKYYSSIGMTKQDLCKIITNSALKSALLEYYYGENSKKNPTSTQELKNAFVEKYIGVNIIAASLTTTDALGSTVPMDTYELSNIRNMFYTMRDKLNGGADIDSVYSDYITTLDLIGTQSLDIYVITESSVGYGENFFAQVSALRYKTAVVIEYEDTIYLAYRIDISDDDLGYFMNYKSDILEQLCMSKLDKKIASQADEYELIKEHTAVTRKIRSLVEQAHTAE